MTEKEIEKLKIALNGRRFFEKPTISDVLKILSIIVVVLFFLFGFKNDINTNTQAIKWSKENYQRLEEDIDEIKKDVKEILKKY